MKKAQIYEDTKKNVAIGKPLWIKICFSLRKAAYWLHKTYTSTKWAFLKIILHLQLYLVIKMISLLVTLQPG